MKRSEMKNLVCKSDAPKILHYVQDDQISHRKRSPLFIKREKYPLDKGGCPKDRGICKRFFAMLRMTSVMKSGFLSQFSPSKWRVGCEMDFSHLLEMTVLRLRFFAVFRMISVMCSRFLTYVRNDFWKSQAKLKIKKIYFKTTKTHKNGYRFELILTKFVTNRRIIRNLNCKGRSRLNNMRTCLQMPISSSLLGWR